MKKANYFCNANQAKDYYVLLRDQLFQQNRKKFLNQIKFKDHYQQKGMISQQQNKSNQRYKMRKSNSKSSININPILQPQQPQNYLNLSKQNKKISIISCKSQPIDLTINQANQNKNISMKCSQHQNQYVPENYHENDNKKTRKHFTKPYDHFQQTAKNYHQDQYYAVDNLENLKKQKTLKNISSNYHNHLKNEDTLRIKKSQCEHKKSKKKQSENLKSLQALQNIEKRISFCQAYLNLSERKTNFLAKQVDFLVNKQFLRESKKYHKISSERLGHCHSQKIIFPYHGEPLPTKEFFKEKRHNCNHKLQKQHQRQQVLNKSERNSSNKFHFRSSENKFSRMKQLLKFHEKQKNQNKYDHHLKPTKALKNYDEQTSIYNTNSRIKQKNHKEQKNYKRYEENSDEQLKNNEDLRSRGKNYQNNESYLLQQEDQYQTNFKMQNNNLKFNRILPAQQQIPYIKSEIALESENQQKQKDQRSLNEENGQKNIYLTRQFQPFTQKNHKIGINQFNYQSSEKEIIRHATNSKIGHFKLVSKNSNQVQKNQNPIKSQNKPHILVDSGKSSQTFKQKQYTFIRSGQSSKKDDLLDNYQVIESYGNSDKYQKDTSQVDSRQSQLIEEFNELVVAVTNEETPMKKKIIQEQIYRTSKELKELNQKKIKSDSKNTYR